MRDDYPEGLVEFEERFGLNFTTGILEEIEGSTSSDCNKWNGHIFLYRCDTLDREGGNRRLAGYVRVGPREWEFDIQSGNWAGTEIKYFERMRASGIVPANTLWMFMPVPAIVTKMWMQGHQKFLYRAFENFIEKGTEAAIWRTPFH